MTKTKTRHISKDSLQKAYQAIMQVNILAGPHSLLKADSARLARILQITDKALTMLNSEHTADVAAALGLWED